LIAFNKLSAEPYFINLKSVYSFSCGYFLGWTLCKFSFYDTLILASGTYQITLTGSFGEFNITCMAAVAVVLLKGSLLYKTDVFKQLYYPEIVCCRTHIFITRVSYCVDV
jgi:hypothetical protein